MKNVLQVELPFDNGGFTQTLERLIAYAAQAKSSGKRHRSHSPNLVGVNLDLPLLCELVPGAEYEWGGSENRDGDISLEQPESQPSTPNEFKLLADKGTNTEFSDKFNINDVCKIASRLLYGELSTLFNSRGNAKVKEEILNWIFAEKYYFDEVPQKKPMRLIPFTAAFCCEVEEIDYDDLCEVIHTSLDLLRNIEPSETTQTIGNTYANHSITQSSFALQ